MQQNKIKILNWKEFSPKNFLRLISLIVGIIFIISILILVFFPDPFINTFLKNRIIKTFAETYPEYRLQLGDMHYNFWDNRLGCDSLKLESTDSSFKFSTASVSVSGISWLNIFLKSDANSSAFNGAVIDAKNILFNFNKIQYELLVNAVHASVPDSSLIADSIKYYPSAIDQHFFASSKFRQTRFRFDIPRLNILGLDILALLKGNIYRAKSINIKDIIADVLVNKEKPYDATSSNPLMPNEAFLSINETIKLDSLNIVNGSFKYRERFSLNSAPALITFDKIQLSVTKIDNHKTLPDTTIIHSESVFMNSSKMKLFMAIPLMSKDFSLKYSGTFSEMDITKLNAFIEPSEHQRIKSGSLQSANFNITVNSGNANGRLNLAYKDLNVAILNEKTNSENGIFDKISSLIGKIFVLRGTNTPDEKGVSKIGIIKYHRNPQDYFMQYIWFALRSGVGDVVGF
jgi:hypothetical protein